MLVKNAQFVLSAISPSQYPDSNLLEVAFAGRSNVGKSSLINALLGRKNLARSGSRQGMTRLINYYNLDNELHFVDLPGYGYAAVSKEEKNLWGKVITNYLTVREQLYVVVLLLDIRHKPTKEDQQMLSWMRQSGLACLFVANKADKIGRSALPKQLQLLRETLNLGPEEKLIPVSAERRTGLDELWREIDELLQE